MPKPISTTRLSMLHRVLNNSEFSSYKSQSSW